MWTLYCLLSLILFVSVVRSQSLSSNEFKQKVFLDQQQNFQMRWNFNSTHILIQLRVATTGWIGVGFSSSGSMAHADIYVGWVSGGRAIITDRHGLDGNTFPPLDSEQNVKLIEGKECNGETVITFVRQLAACQQGEDREITSATARVIYAFSLQDPVDEFSVSNYHGFQHRGSKSLLLLQSQISGETPVNDTDARTFDVVADGEPLPRKKTFYKCQLIKLPELNKTHHMIKSEPLINATYLQNVHHMSISICSKKYDNILKRFYGTSAECYRSRFAALSQYCRVPFGGWTVGDSGILYPKNAGIPIGEADTGRYVRLEIHYDNPYLEEIRDNSGMRFTYTPNLREYHAAAMAVALPSTATQIVIPPNTEEFKVYGSCDSACLGAAMKKAGVNSINIFGVLPHSHLAGRKIELLHFRNGVELPPITKDDSYDFNYQKHYLITPERAIRKGDELMTICTYSSMGKSRPILGGLSTSEEMCFNFVYFYPRIPLGFCSAGPSSPVNDKLKKILNISEVWDSAPEKSYRAKTINDFLVSSPEDKANQSLGDVISSFSWDKNSIKTLEESWKNSYKFSFCGGPQPEVPMIRYRAPIPAWEPYHFPPPKRCVPPFNGFASNKTTGTCQSSHV